MKERLSLTPGTPRFTARRIENPEDKVNSEDHEIYRSGVGTLLYLTKHSRPDICNPVRELSKTMDAPAPVHLKEMYKVLRHVLSTKGYGLKFELRKDIIKWALKALSDSDFASDKETRISVFGYIIYFCGIPIAWRSKGMKSVVLSTTEAEYMALSEVVKELKFIVQLLQTMNIEVELPITVHVDNVGAIWLSNNRTTSDRTKHIDIRTSFVKEYQEDGKIIIKFVKSEENEADIFTKNTTNVIFSNHQKKLVWDKTNVVHEMNKVKVRINMKDVENLNQVRTDRRTVELRFSWECVLSHTWMDPWTQNGISLCEMDPRKRSVTYVFMDDETSV